MLPKRNSWEGALVETSITTMALFKVSFTLMAIATMIYFKHKDLEDTYLFVKLSLWRLMIALIMDDIIASIN